MLYDDAVEEALCFGWIDSIVRKIDDERYCQKFTPRKENSNWKQYIDWIASAKKEETKQRRVSEAMSLLERKQKLGMK